MSSPASQPSPASALEPSPLPTAAVGGLPSSAGPASLLGLGIAVESVSSSVDVPPVAAELDSGGATGGGGGSSDPTARPLPSPDPTTNGSGSLAARRPSLAARSSSTTPLPPPSGYSDRHEPLLDATGVRVEADGWRVSVAADDGAGSRGRTRGKLCVYIHCTYSFRRASKRRSRARSSDRSEADSRLTPFHRSDGRDCSSGHAQLYAAADRQGDQGVARQGQQITDAREPPWRCRLTSAC
jgi:hypothetical protein